MILYRNHNVISMDRRQIKLTENQSNKKKEREKKRGWGKEKRDTIFDINVFVALCPAISMQRHQFGFQITARVHPSNFCGSSIRSCVSVSRGALHREKKGRHRYNSTISWRRIGTIMSTIFRWHYRVDILCRKSEQDCCQAMIRLEDSFWRSRTPKSKKIF